MKLKTVCLVLLLFLVAFFSEGVVRFLIGNSSLSHNISLMIHFISLALVGYLISRESKTPVLSVLIAMFMVVLVYRVFVFGSMALFYYLNFSMFEYVTDDLMSSSYRMQILMAFFKQYATCAGASIVGLAYARYS